MWRSPIGSSSGNIYMLQRCIASTLSFLLLGALHGKAQSGVESVRMQPLEGWVAAPEGRFPFVVQVTSDGQKCGSVLLNDCFLLTAASCVKGATPDRRRIAATLVRRNAEGSEPETVEVDAMHPHPKWNGNIQDGYDAALLRLSRPVDGQPPLLASPTSILYPGKVVFLLRQDEEPQFAQFSVVGNDFFPSTTGLEPHMFIAHSELANLQPGDVGGPAILPHRPSNDSLQCSHDGNTTCVDGGMPERDVLVGVLSYVDISPTERVGGMFTRVGSLQGWIRDSLFQMDDFPEVLGEDYLYKGPARCSGRAYADQWASQEHWGGWVRAPRRRFKALVSIRGRGREHVCTGIMVSPFYILTSANCVDIVGPNPIVIIGPQGIDEDRRTKGVQEQRAEMAHPHPRWSGKVEDGHDIALLKLPRQVSVPFPSLAPPGFTLLPNSKAYALKLGPSLEIAQFIIVDIELCPNLTNLHESMFCAYSSSVSMQSGASGGPMLVIASDDIRLADPSRDLVVGAVSCANYSALDESGVGCVLISGVQDWIQQIIAPKDQQQRAAHLSAALVITFIIFLVGFIVTPFITPRVFYVLLFVELLSLVVLLGVWNEASGGKVADLFLRTLSDTVEAAIAGLDDALPVNSTAMEGVHRVLHDTILSQTFWKENLRPIAVAVVVAVLSLWAVWGLLAGAVWGQGARRAG